MLKYSTLVTTEYLGVGEGGSRGWERPLQSSMPRAQPAGMGPGPPNLQSCFLHLSSSRLRAAQTFWSSETGQLCPGVISSLRSWAASVGQICRMGWLDFKELFRPKTSGPCDSGIVKCPFPSPPQLSRLPSPSIPAFQPSQPSVHVPMGSERSDWALRVSLLLHTPPVWNDLSPEAGSPFRSWLRQVLTS